MAQSKREILLKRFRAVAVGVCLAGGAATTSFLAVNSFSPPDSLSEVKITKNKLKNSAAMPEEQSKPRETGIVLEGTYTQSRLPSDGQVGALKAKIQSAVAEVIEINRSFMGGGYKNDNQAQPQSEYIKVGEAEPFGWKSIFTFNNIRTPQQQVATAAAYVVGAGLTALLAMSRWISRQVIQTPPRSKSNRAKGPSILPVRSRKQLRADNRITPTNAERALITREARQAARAERNQQLPETGITPVPNYSPETVEAPKALTVITPGDASSYKANAADALAYFRNLKGLRRNGFTVGRASDADGVFEVFEKRGMKTELLLSVDTVSGAITVWNEDRSAEWLDRYLREVRAYNNRENLPVIVIEGLYTENKSAENIAGVLTDSITDSISLPPAKRKSGMIINGRTVTPEIILEAHYKSLAHSQTAIAEAMGEVYGFEAPLAATITVQETNIYSQAASAELLAEHQAAIIVQNAAAAEKAAAVATTQAREAEIVARFAAGAQRKAEAETQAIYKAVEDFAAQTSTSMLRQEWRHAANIAKRIRYDDFAPLEMRTTLATMARLIPTAYGHDAVTAAKRARYAVNKLFDETFYENRTEAAATAATVLATMQQNLGVVRAQDSKLAGEIERFVAKATIKAFKTFGADFNPTYDTAGITLTSVTKAPARDPKTGRFVRIAAEQPIHADVPVAEAHAQSPVEVKGFVDRAVEWAQGNIDLKTYNITDPKDGSNTVRIRQIEGWRLVMSMNPEEIVLYTREKDGQQIGEIPPEWINMTLKAVNELHGDATITVRDNDMRTAMEARAEKLGLKGITFEVAAHLNTPAIEVIETANASQQPARPATDNVIRIVSARKRNSAPTLTPGGGGQSAAA